MHDLVLENNGRVASMIYISGGFSCDAKTERSKLYPGSSAPRGYLDGSQMPFDDLYDKPAMRRRVENRLREESPLRIQLATTKSSCTVRIDNESNNTVSGKLYVILIENDIDCPQASWSVKVAHGIPRKAIAAAAGESISIDGDDTFTKDYNFTISSSWDEDNCKVLALVQKSDKEIIQVKEVGLDVTEIDRPVINKNSGNSLNVFKNGSNGDIAISFTLDRPMQVSLYVYNSAGKRVKKLKSGDLKMGNHLVYWKLRDNDYSNVAKGIYFIRFITNNSTRSKKVILW